MILSLTLLHIIVVDACVAIAIFLNENICTCTRSGCVKWLYKIQNACHHQVYFEQLRQEKVAESARETRVIQKETHITKL